MCGRFTLSAGPDELERVFGQAPQPGYRRRFNIAPMQEVLGIVDEEGIPRPRMLRWGLVPFWADDPSIGNRMINARAETIAEKPAYRNAFSRRRCLVLADGFFEWQKRPDGKHPMWIRVHGGEPFAFAAVWERWERGPSPLETCSILTRAANPFMLPIHERMPVILDRPARDAWLSPKTPRDELLAMLGAEPEVELTAHEVSTLVNNPANDREECVQPVR